MSYPFIYNIAICCWIGDPKTTPYGSNLPRGKGKKGAAIWRESFRLYATRSLWTKRHPARKVPMGQPSTIRDLCFSYDSDTREVSQFLLYDLRFLHGTPSISNRSAQDQAFVTYLRTVQQRKDSCSNHHPMIPIVRRTGKAS